MKGLILVNAYSTLQSSLHQAERLAEEFARLGVETEIRRNDFFPLSIGRDGNIGTLSGEYAFCVYLDKDKYVSDLLERAGLRLFNCHRAIADCDDKMRTAIVLAGQGVPMPKTLPGLLCYDPDAPVRGETADRVAALLGYPVVVKECYGSLGKGVFKAEDRSELCAVMERVKCSEHLFQEFVSESAGRDIRVIVIGGRAIAAMRRVSGSDFRSNIGLGAGGEAYALGAPLRDLCERTAHILKLDYCGIDVLFGREGYLVCEVNSNAFFGAFERVTGVNVARLYAEHILRTMEGRVADSSESACMHC